MEYCEANSTFDTIWRSGGFSRCFFDTIVAVLTTLLLIIFGGFEARLYYRHGSAVEPDMLGPPPFLYITQLVLSIICALLHPLRMVLEVVYKQLLGFVIVRDGLGGLVWLAATYLVYMERNFDLPGPPGRHGHGIYLCVFWFFALVVDSLYIINIRGDDWFFALHSSYDFALLVVFIVNWLCELVIFVIGIRAPGLITLAQRNQYIYRPMSEPPPIKYGSNGEAEGRGRRGGGYAPLMESMGTIDDDGQSSGIDASSSGRRSTYSLQEDCRQAVEQLKRNLESGRMANEFYELPRQSEHGIVNVAKLRANEPKNRYLNVLPYDHSRVRLSTTDDDVIDSGHDYINASWIEISIPEVRRINRYIACQGPMSHTLEDFWRMVLECHVPVIVMLTDCHERGMPKCDQYWPNVSESIQLAPDVVLLNVFEERGRGWTRRELSLVRAGGGGGGSRAGPVEHSLVQLHLHGVPDHGAPRDTRRMLQFWQAVRKSLPDSYSTSKSSAERYHEPIRSPPIVVHCSAGVGRTGGYILMESLITLMESDSAQLDPLALIRTMREQRMAMVQTADQLEFACRAALAYYQQKAQNRRV